jgi:hypothetical protein
VRMVMANRVIITNGFKDLVFILLTKVKGYVEFKVY